MKSSIVKQLNPAYTGTSAECDTVETTDAVWQVCVRDWSTKADTGLFNPWDAYANALNEGKKLGQDLVNDNYDFIHFIAHSAGSQVADMAARWIDALAKTQGFNKPEIHTTFLDAFDPSGDSSLYGEYSDWAEQYVDSRLTALKVGGDDFTRIKLPNAYNFDVTALDTVETDVLGIHAHGWPVTLYQDSVDNPLNYGFGFNHSMAYGANPSHNAKPRGQRCIALSAFDCSEDPKSAVSFDKRMVINDLLTYIKFADALISLTGIVDLNLTTTWKILKLINGSPVWITMPFELAEPVNFISFDYTFQQAAEGLLSVFFDGQLVYRADQRLDETGTVYHSGDVPIGEITGGTHSLSFRLDAYNGTKSEIDISNAKLGNKQVIETPVIPPIANAGPDQTVRLGSLVTLNGSGSNDPDNGPSPLSFAWSKTAGPTVNLTSPSTAKPTFTPNTAGGYTFSLVVKDGTSDSAPDTVTIAVPKLGDIDLDGDVDKNDLAKITAALNKPASSPNDLRDLNGDMKIDALDTRKLALLCTRPSCAI